MIIRRPTLDEALNDLEGGSLKGASIVVVGHDWWNRVPPREQDAYRGRAERAGVRLHADDAMSGHYVEIHDDTVPPLSSEHPT